MFNAWETNNFHHRAWRKIIGRIQLHLQAARIILEVQDFSRRPPGDSAGDFDAPFRLKDRIAQLRQNYSVIVIDTPPALGLITVNALVAANYVLIPIQSSYFALEGTDDLLETIEKVKARPNPDLQIIGVLVTLHDKRTTLGREVFDQIRRVFGPKLFDTVITKSVRLEESPAYKESIFTFAPQSSGAIEYAQLCEEVMSRV